MLTLKHHLTLALFNLHGILNLDELLLIGIISRVLRKPTTSIIMLSEGDQRVIEAALDSEVLWGSKWWLSSYWLLNRWGVARHGSTFERARDMVREIEKGQRIFLTTQKVDVRASQGRQISRCQKSSATSSMPLKCCFYWATPCLIRLDNSLSNICFLVPAFY
jgi:hypothetical protein